MVKTTKDDKNKVWRPQQFTEVQIKKIVDDFKKYIEEEEDPTIVWFTCSYPPIHSKQLGRKCYINKDYISDHEEFSELRRIAIEKQENYLVKWVTKNQLNATMWVFRLKQPQHWYTDRQQVENINTNIELQTTKEEQEEIKRIMRENL